MAKRQKFHVGDQVRVKQYGGRVGDTTYEVVSLAGLACTIRETGGGDRPYRAQQFDTSLLVRVRRASRLTANPE
jgi:hypothetical protein